MYTFSSPERAFLESMKVGRLATNDGRPMSRPHCVPVCYALIDSQIWIAIDQKPKSGRPLRRLSNIETNPQVALTLDHYEDDWTKLAYLLVEGTAQRRLLEAKTVLALVERYPQYAKMTLVEGIAITPSRSVFWRAS